MSSKSNSASLMLAAIGVVFGDIGTSPLYTLKEVFHGSHGILPSHDNVLGALSLVLWALLIVVSLKYVIFIMRADNNGEGGIMAADERLAVHSAPAGCSRGPQLRSGEEKPGGS